MIFLDVGAHEGQTLEEVTKPIYDFSRIIAFEPMPDQFVTLMERYGESVTLVNCGLSDRDGLLFMYGTNEHLEASLFSDHKDVDPRVRQTVVVIDAGQYFKSDIHEPVTMKLNCEGAECSIIRSIVAAEQHHKIAQVMIDFDVRKIPSRAHEEGETRDLMHAHKIPYVLSEDVMYGPTHQERIAWWLAGKKWPR